MNKPYSEFDETYFKKMLENNALYFNQQLKKFLKPKNFGILKKLSYHTLRTSFPQCDLKTFKKFLKQFLGLNT